MSLPKLYSFAMSSCSWRARIVLNLKNIEYEYAPVNTRDKQQQKDDSYTEINPNQKVPTLSIDEMDISESMVICNYLDKKYPDPPLYPTDELMNIRVQEVCEYINSSIQPLQNIGVIEKVKQEGNISQTKWASFFIRKGLTAVDTRIKPFRGVCSFGNDPTMADVFLYPQISHARRFEIDVESEFPMLYKIEQHLHTIEEFQNARPEHQIDATS